MRVGLGLNPLVGHVRTVNPDSRLLVSGPFFRLKAASLLRVLFRLEAASLLRVFFGLKASLLGSVFGLEKLRF